jgi:hypothetical protein
MPIKSTRFPGASHFALLADCCLSGRAATDQSEVDGQALEGFE